MAKLLITGDWHLRGSTPRNRTDDYREASKLKILEIFEIAKRDKVDAIICPGDIWNSPEVSIAVLLEFSKLLSESPVPIHTTPGNHDLFGYNLQSYERSSLKLLELLTPNFNVHLDPTKPVVIGDMVLSFQPYSSEVDVYGFGYDVPVEITERYPNHKKLKVTHGYCMLNAPIWDRYTLIGECVTTADMVINGHDHKGHRVFERSDGKLFCNPGALMRMDASVQNIDRQIEVAIVGTEGGDLHYGFVPITTAKPGDEVLDRSRIEAENQRRAAMDSFKVLIEAKTGGKALVDINQVVQEIAAAEGIAPEVVEIALEKVNAERGKE